MTVIIEEIQAEVVPGPGAGVEDAALVQPAEAAPEQRWLDLLELAREREERLHVD